jgi:hypothetical protein
MPAAVGFPDYQRLSVQAGQILATMKQALGTNPATGAIDTTGYQYLYLGINNIGGTGHFLVQVIWYTDKALTTQITTQSFIPQTNSQMAKQVPVLSRWCKVQFTQYTAGAADAPILDVFGSNAYAPNPLTEQAFAPFLYFGSSQPAGGGTSIDATTTYEGPAVLTGDQGVNNSWAVRLYYYDLLSDTYLPFFTLRGASVGEAGVASVNLPPTPVAMKVYNLDTVARTVYGAVIT